MPAHKKKNKKQQQAALKMMKHRSHTPQKASPTSKNPSLKSAAPLAALASLLPAQAHPQYMYQYQNR